MKIGLIDNELITRPSHNFPNLAIMKLSAWHKQQGDNVSLINFDMINPNTLFTERFDKVFVSKVFSDTPTPNFIDSLPFVKKGGSGFYYDKAERLPDEIEHIKPDYELYNKYLGEYYHNFSIGFITRGCIRQCSFCINRNYKKVSFHSNPLEFIDEKKPFVMLLDDNITAYKDFKGVFDNLNAIGKPFVFKQGMDFRLLNEEKMNILWNSNYYSTNKEKRNKGNRVFHFAFDNIDDYDLIHKRLKQYYYTKPYCFGVMFYVLCGFDRENKYDVEFYVKDFESVLKRIQLLCAYDAKPYIMIHENINNSPFKDEIYALRNIFNYPVTYLSGLEKAIKKNKKLCNLIDADYKWFYGIEINQKFYKKTKYEPSI